MSQSKPSYEELKQRLEQAEAILKALRRGELDLLVGEAGPLVVQFKSLVEEKSRLFQEKEKLAAEWQATFDAAQDAIWLLDVNQRIIRTNKAAERIFGHTAQEMIGKYCCEIMYGSKQPVSFCPFKRMRKSLQRETTHMQFGRRWLEIVVDPLLNEKQELTGCIHIASDITAQKRHERELEAEAMLAQALSETLELRPLLERLLQAACHAIPSGEKGSVLLLERDGRLRIHALYGYSDARLENFPFASDSGYSARTVRERTPLLLSDVRADPSIRYDGEIEEARAIYSAITAPLMLHDEIIGVLSLDSTRRAAFEQADLAFLTHFAASAALVVERARLFEQSRLHNENLKAINAMGRALASTFDLETIYDQVRQSIYALLPEISGVMINLFDEEKQLITCAYRHTDDEAQDVSSLPAIPLGPPGSDTQSRAIHSREPLVIHHFQEQLEKARVHVTIGKEGEPRRSSMYVPMLTQGKVISLIIVQSPIEERFNEQDVELTSLIANTAAVAIQNARLFQQTQRQTEKMAAVNALGRALATTLDLPIIYRRAYQHIRQLLDCDNFGITELDEERGALRIAFLLCDGQEMNVETAPPLPIEPSMPHTGRVGAILDARPILMNDLAEATRQGGGMLIGNEREPQSAAYTPMIVEGKVIGLLELQSYRNHAYREEDTDLLKMLANQIGLAIQNARLLAETRQQLKELEILQSVSAALRQAHTVEEMIPLFIGHATRAINASAGSIYLLEETSGDWVSQGWIDPSGSWIGKQVELRHRPGEGVTGRVGSSGEIYITADWRTDTVTCRLPEEERFLEGLTSGISLPLQDEQRIFGVFHIWHKEAHVFDQAEQRLLMAIVNMAGNALQRARLFNEAQQRIQQLRALHAIDTAISASMDARLAFNILLEHTVRQLQVDAAGILLLNRGLLVLEYAAGRGFRSRQYEHTSLQVGEGTASLLTLERQIVHIAHLEKTEFPFQHKELVREEGFVLYAAAPLVAKGQVKGALEVFHRSPKTVSSEWLEFLNALAQQAAIALESAQLFDHLQRANLELFLAYETTLEGWSSAMDLRDKETEGHTQRVTELTLQLARAMNISQEQLIHIRRGALLHDIGKMGIPDAILFKPGPLDEQEWAIMRQHPQYAYEMLSTIVYLHPALDIPYCHHEKWDGSGYPRGLKGEEIPLAARIFAVADVWDALTSDRPYRKAWPKEKAIEYIRSQAGRHFDPQVVDYFLRIVV